MSRSAYSPSANEISSSRSFGLHRLPTWLAAAVFIALSFLFYGNTLRNDTALDDPMVLVNNTFVQSGVKGIPEIFKHDSFYGATHRPASQLSWRYRPLSLAFFALLYELFGKDWAVYHFFNVFLYGLTCIAAFGFLKRHVFTTNPLFPWLATLFFLIHPVHTEVVANIKSCDELLSLLFLIITYDRLLCFAKHSRKKDLLLAVTACVCALFSKESSLLMVALIPLLLYTFTRNGISVIFRQTVPFAVLSLLFLLIRLMVSRVPEAANDLPNSPYLLATGVQKAATVLVVLGDYLRLMFYPSPLIFDYGYNHIPYTGFDDYRPWISAALHLTLLVFAIRWCFRRLPAGFFLSGYLIGILFISNFFFDVGPIMADRFLYVPGFFLIIALLIAVEQVPETVVARRKEHILSALLVVATPFAFVKTVSRNADWKDNRTLYTADLEKAPDSYRVLAFNAMVLCDDAGKMNDSLRRRNTYLESIRLFHAAYAIYPDYKMMYNNWGFAYYSLGLLDSAEWAWGRQRELNPGSQYIAYNKDLLEQARYDQCLQVYNARYRDGNNYPFLKKVLLEALSYRPAESSGWTILGKVYYLNAQRDSARICWAKAVELDSGNAEAKSLLKID